MSARGLAALGVLATHPAPIFTPFLSSRQSKHQGFKIIHECPVPTSPDSPLDHLLDTNFNTLPWVRNNYFWFRNGILRYRNTRVMDPHPDVNVHRAPTRNHKSRGLVHRNGYKTISTPATTYANTWTVLPCSLQGKNFLFKQQHFTNFFIPLAYFPLAVGLPQK